MKPLGGRFTLLREIGSGGMFRVFLGRDETLDRPVAVKVLKTGYAGTDIGARFRREGRTAAKLSHPNIVQVYDAGEGEFEGEEASFIVMEYVSGGDLKALIDERGVLAGDHLSAMGAEVAAGLAHAHERGVIHRDVKPHNILLEERGRARLTDFGIARALDVTQVTQTGFYLGTALYSSPEQLRGESVTPKSDVYSLGATLYQAATGEPPFTGAPIEVASQHVSREPVPPQEINPEVSGAMQALILACMSKDPNSRPTADEARMALLETGREANATLAQENAPAKKSAPPAAPPSGMAREGRRRRSGAVAAILGLVAMLAVIGALAAYTLSGGEKQANSGGQADGGQANAQPNDPSAGGRGDQEPSDVQTATPETSSGASTSASSEASTSATSSASSETASRDRSPADGSGTSGDSAEAAAARAVEDVYVTAADGDYGTSYGLLSEDFKASQATTQAAWGGQFDTLLNIRFVQGPNARVTGNTATVTGTTIAEHTDWTERNTATWTLVREGEEWKLEDLSIESQEL
ncbi:MAG: serine/threonine protein kinase, partial [Actinomycetota bacterium]|nr:serine/threonine protein kinase [Actinomycetota bacterium]